jgi:hypothetical protein
VAKAQRIPVAWMKVYAASGNFLASCVDAGSAAAVVSLAGDGATIRNGHAKKGAIWTEGAETQPAAESYDFVAQVIHDRTTASVPVVDVDQDRRVDAAMESTRATVRAMISAIPN